MAAHDRKKGKQTAAHTDNNKNDSTITPLPKRSKKSRKQSFLDLASQTVAGDGPLVPMDPVERYAWDRVWDWFIETTRPYVLAYAQTETVTTQQRKAA